MESHPRPGEDPLKVSVLVLNRVYRPVRVVNARRAFTFLYKNDAEAIAHVDARYQNYPFDHWIRFSADQVRQGLDGHDYVHTPTTTLIVPRVIRLLNCDRVPKKTIRFSRRNVMARDEYRCQYCAKRLPASALSVDHVIPRSRGGKTDWTNVVAACAPCNTRKGGRLPKEARMALLRVPVQPKNNPLLQDKVRTGKYAVWKDFIGDDTLTMDIH